ncbi:hypothetical protein EYB26_002068 [Talaromyces marneffei]|uniref:uncharacterized protein n=1 Tax=Talaromyces marneffei TaxID=37727 RepID=UPI0012A8CB20|nr:uncharacterized protein EYB26_002068 [Talaromyces marneffei]QGA14415.1 hypothetical protein EYB26_002068 [Talaromyces marneffei]
MDPDRITIPWDIFPNITELDSRVHLDDQLQPERIKEHIPRTSELGVDPKQQRNLEDWERFRTARKQKNDSGHETSKINSLGRSPFSYDGTKHELGRSGETTNKSFSPPPIWPSRRKHEPSIHGQKSSDSIATAGSVRAKRLVVKLRYGRRNRRRVDALLKLPGKRNISEGVHALPQTPTAPSHGDYFLWEQRDQELKNNLNDGVRKSIEAFSKTNDRISPGESSNEVMMRYESNAKELEIASRAATDASHRSFTSEEDFDAATDISRSSSSSRKEDYPTRTPVKSHDDQRHSIVKCLCNCQDNADDMVMCEKCFTWQHTECYYRGRNELAERQVEKKLHWHPNGPIRMAPKQERHFCIECASSDDPRQIYPDRYNMDTQGLRFPPSPIAHSMPSTSLVDSHVPDHDNSPRSEFGTNLIDTHVPDHDNSPRSEFDINLIDSYVSRRGNSLDRYVPDCDIAHSVFDTSWLDSYFPETRLQSKKPRRHRSESTRPQFPVENSIPQETLNQLWNTTFSQEFYRDPSQSMQAISNNSPGELPVAKLAITQSVDHQRLFMTETYTDSGYASNSARASKSLEVLGQVSQAEGLSPHVADIESRSASSLDENIQRTEQEDDVASIYSDASTIPTFTKARYIDGLADDLAQAIQPYQLDNEIIQQLVEKLPELLKAFALTFGHHESGMMQRDVMVFIHRYRRQIVKTLNDHILMEEAGNQNRDQENQMSLNEKMNLWHNSGESTQDERFDNADYNDNLDTKNPDVRETQDDEEEEQEEDHDSEADETEFPGLAAYRSLIRGAPAYNWFLNNIRRECALAPPELNLIGEIRNTILDALPSSPKISRRKPAETFNMSFMVDWDPVAFLREEEYTESSENAIEGAIILTGSTVSAQALTCGEYLRQTWPSTGEQILDLIKSLVSGRSRASVTLLNGSSLTVSYNHSENPESSTTVWVDAHGTAACIAEIGEQFAWLASALRSSPFQQQIAYSRPFIGGIQIGHVTYEETTYICRIGVKLHEGRGDSETTNGECWHGLFDRPVVVEGFPIPRRSEEESPGLEIPLNIMGGLTQARRVGSFGGKTLLKGFATMLLPMKRTKDIVTWHLVQARDGERISYLEAGNFQSADIQMPELEKSRHVLGWCPEMKLYAGAADAYYLIKGSRLHRPSGQGGLGDASLSLGHLITGGTPFSEGRKDIRLRRNSYIVRMKWISQKFVILWDVEDKRGWLVNGASALLHLVRASLAQDIFDNKFAALCLFSTKEFQEASQVHQTDAALEVLLNPNNLKAKIYPEEDDFIRFKAYVEDFSDLLEKMLDYQSRVVNDNVPRSLLEGWDFNDLATGRDPIYPREALLSQEALSWVDFTRSIHAITLFSRSFGEVIQPARECCSAWAKVPRERSYLAASATDLYRIMESDGDPYSVPMRLTHDILWYTSKETFAQCQCNSATDHDTHSDIAQVLLPSRLHRELSGTCSQLPPKRGAVIFGYNNTHRWFWGDTGDPSRTPNESGRMLSFNKGVRDSQFSDSGIGKSLGSSASMTGSSSNQLDEEHTEYTHAVNSESEDHQSSSSNNKRNYQSGSSTGSSPLASHYKVGIVCALHIELMAVRASFDKTYEKVAIASEDPNYYALGSIEGHNVVAVCLPHGVYGMNAAADVTSNMKRSFPGLKFCLLVGIGAGVPSQRNDIRLGDVVISTPKGGYSGVLPYDMIKSTDSGAFELNGYLSPPPAHLMCAISELESDPSRSSTPLHKYLQQIEQCREQYRHPGVVHDRLFASHYTHNGDLNNVSNCDQCDFAYEIRRPPRSSTHPEIHYGLIASGNQVMKSAKIRDKLSQEHNVLCFEMEGAGIMNNFPCLIIRGICDYADSHKNKCWQNYAAATAAAYAKLLLSRLRTADGFELGPSELPSRKRTTTTEWGEDMPATKRR